MPIDADTFKSLSASWASGVTIVTSRLGDRVQGMTVSAFTEVSLDPPLFLFCADRTSGTGELVEESGVFGASLLAREQEDLSNRFASKKLEASRFDGLDCPEGETGCPRIPGALAHIDCTVVQRVEAGDHVIYIGRADAATITERSPLVYFRQAYRGIL